MQDIFAVLFLIFSLGKLPTVPLKVALVYVLLTRFKLRVRSSLLGSLSRQITASIRRDSVLLSMPRRFSNEKVQKKVLYKSE